ncbi:uncharacterized protein [Hyperolius riggenbachi]|uniref:uncharacterized protein n=1 Tax=Hyperolius riggenbachi TaxID=752182 RepID=UPI0035A28A92
MKFFIFFMLVGLGHCQGDVPQAVKCTLDLLAQSTDFVDAALKEACALKGKSTDEEKKLAVENLNSQIEAVAEKAGCPVKELVGADLAEALKSTSQNINDVLIKVDEKLLTKIGLIKEVVAFVCTLTNTVTDSECFTKVKEILQNSVKKPLGGIAGLLNCQVNNGNINLQTVSDLLVQGECLQVAPNVLGLDPTITNSITSLATNLVKSLLDTVTGLTNSVTGLVGGIACPLVNTLDGVLGQVGGAGGGASAEGAGANVAASGSVGKGGANNGGLLGLGKIL